MNCDTKNEPNSIVLRLMTVIVIFLTYILWHYWPELLLQAIHWQRDLNSQLSDLLYDIQENKSHAWSTFIVVSFGYGILHSMGPGHGKVIVATYLMTQPSNAKSSLYITVLSSILQAVVAIALVTTLLAVFQSSMREIHSHAEVVMKLSYFCVALLGFTLCYKALRKLVFVKREKGLQQQASNTQNGSCTDSSYREKAAIILAIGLRPCTGAIMILLFANMVGLYWVGIVSALIMAIGTCITTSCIALMTLSGKKVVLGYMKHSTKPVRSNLPQVFKLVGGILVAAFGILLMQSTAPAFSSVI
ncbi:nickel/cobalt transporter [Vibrio tapetis]|uniref:Nickel/cobalt efflux system n=1 Tax=Vibrio tapetis subsp. tapetis TaxID=1671868 RepID=A0A2N8ZL36_9VIBR|nr:nickel/cobalt transporter [Vibrio tapetis]SON52623.1 putative Nickel/cobalt transporter,high-affinity [Vibrio tapetis subsp. tapetis]